MLDAVEPGACRACGAQPHEPLRRDLAWDRPAVADVGAERPDEQRFAAPERAAPALDVAAPERLARAHPRTGPQPKPAQRDCERRIQPHDELRAVAHERAELPAVV